MNEFDEDTFEGGLLFILATKTFWFYPNVARSRRVTFHFRISDSSSKKKKH